MCLMSNVQTRNATCLVTLHRWYGIHCRAQFLQFLITDNQTKRVVTRFCVARIPRWESPWCELNTLRRRAFGTYFVDRYIAIYLCYGRENVFFSVVTRMYRSWRNRVARCHFLGRWREFGRLRTSQSLRCVKERRQLCCPDLLHNGCRSWIVRRNWDTEIVEANISLDVD